MSLVGLDIGTTGCKAVAFSHEGKMLASAGKEYPLLHPFVGAAELDPQQVWEYVKDTLSQINARVKSDPVEALAVSSQGESCVPLDRQGNPLANIVVTFDSRTIEQERWWAENVGAKRIFAVTGMPLHPMHTLSKMMWSKEHQPAVYERAWKFLCCEDYVIYRLSGKAALDHSLAARTMAFDVTSRKWSDEMVGLAGVDMDKLAECYPSGTAIGEVTKEVADEIGANNNIIVATGGHDQPCGALGSGVVMPGCAMNATGSNDCILPVMEGVFLDDRMLQSNYCCYPHVFEDMYCSIGFNLTGGLLVRWYRDNFGVEAIERAREGGKDAYEILFDEMGQEIRDLFILPHFVGSGTPYLDARSRGAIVGLTLDVTKEDICRAIVDSINYEMKINIECLEDAGVQIETMRAIGGGSKSEKWLQMKADVFDKPVYSLQVSEAASLGAAILAGKSINVYSSPGEAVDQVVKTKRCFEPSAHMTEQYEEKYQKYKELYKSLKQFNHLLFTG
jgi:xylulokinase